MKTLSLIIVTTAVLVTNAFSQQDPLQKLPPSAKSTLEIPTPMEIARAAVAAHGGDKLKQMKTLIVAGSGEISPSPSQTIPATFRLIIAGERYAFELNNPISPLKQIFDGKQKYSSGYELPPMTSLGFPLLPKVGMEGFEVTALPDLKKKKKGFRMTAPDGFYTDFFVDEKTGQIKGYESSYEVMGRTVTTSVAIDEFQTVEGVIIPKKYSQRFDLGQITAYARFNTKQILVNSVLGDDVFAMPK